MASAFTTCGECRFWHGATRGADRRAGSCKRHAPAAGNRTFQAARWPETRFNDGCGEGEPDAEDATPAVQVCKACAYWNRPGIGIDPAQRGDHLQAWWKQAGWCRRFAPRPGVEIGEHAFWRATHAEDFCYDGRPGREAPDVAPSGIDATGPD